MIDVLFTRPSGMIYTDGLDTRDSNATKQILANCVIRVYCVLYALLVIRMSIIYRKYCEHERGSHRTKKRRGRVSLTVARNPIPVQKKRCLGRK